MKPDTFTIQETFLNVGDGHKLYVQEWGNKQAKIPVIFLHGGPGGGCSDRHKQRFDPKKQRVFFFDQRGSGKSIPSGELKHNTTQDLVLDIQKLVKRFDISEFIVVGGSWGSFLALQYAVAHPVGIQAMLLEGIFTGTNEETDYLNKGGWRSHFPEVWESYIAKTPAKYRDNPTDYHFKQILGKNKAAALKSARIFNDMDMALMKLDDRFTPIPEDDFDSSIQKIEAHYFSNNCFNEISVLDKAPQLKMPVWIVQGRYDFVCPPQNAYNLYKQLQNGHLIWAVSGHRGEHENWNINKTILENLDIV